VVDGYVVTESELFSTEFAVTAQCAPGYHGKAAATPCDGNLAPYVLSGCERDKVCVSPKDTAGYLVDEQDLTMHDFQVNVTCAKGFSGAPSATLCPEEETSYTLAGCEKIVLCSTQLENKGYQVTEAALEKHAFDVTAECAAGYKGKAEVEPCVTDAPYALKGCVPDTTICTVPAAIGYIVQAQSLQIFDFNVTVSCRKGYYGTAAIAPCKSEGAVQLSGCNKIENCERPLDPRGFKLTETSTSIHQFQVAAECAAGYHGLAKVTACTVADEPYVLAGCEPTKVCKAPSTSEGYVLKERSVEVHMFDVAAKCAAGFVGDAAVKPCADNLQEYQLSGCKPITTCTAATASANYVVEEKSLDVHSFQVSVACANGFSGTAKATPCDQHLKPYRLSGCYKAGDTCISPRDSTGYLVKEHNLVGSSFNVAAKCQSTHTGQPKAVGCPEAGTEYALTGCTPKIACMSDPNAEGYRITEASTVVLPYQFDVTAKCAPGYVGTAAIAPCQKAHTSYVLSGCTKDTTVCTRPSIDGYSVNEVELLYGSFNVSAQCAPGHTGTPSAIPCSITGGDYILGGCKLVEKCLAPPNAVGYKLHEADLRVDGFSVSAKCDIGYIGSAVAAPCTQHGGAYILSGCNQVVTCTGPPDATGYLITETSTNEHDFQVASKCAPGWTGTAIASPCSQSGTPYQLAGCTRDKLCTAPVDSTGYKLKENNAWQSTFDVTADCAVGYSGKAEVKPCAADARYVLTGCTK